MEARRASFLATAPALVGFQGLAFLWGGMAAAAFRAAMASWHFRVSYRVEWECELYRRAQLGITDLQEPVPHPDHVRIDMNTGQARLAGPFTKEDKAQFDEILAKRDAFAEELVELRKDLETEQDRGPPSNPQGD